MPRYNVGDHSTEKVLCMLHAGNTVRIGLFPWIRRENSAGEQWTLQESEQACIIFMGVVHAVCVYTFVKVILLPIWLIIDRRMVRENGVHACNW